MKPVRVLLVDDHKLVRAGIRALLDKLAGVEVVAEADNGSQAIQMIRLHSPDVVITDLLMPVMNGIELTAHASKEYPQVRVLIVSEYTDEFYVLQALRAGATGYLVKEADTAELEHALGAVACGDRYLSPAVSRYATADYINRIVGKSDSLKLLTMRQREVLKLIAEGHSTKEVAHFLKVSVKTVETHRAEIMARLEVNNLAGLIRYAIRVGIVTAEQ